jgi:hypothetical protein
VLLTACSAERGLPSDEVLRRASQAVHSLASARFVADVNVSGGDTSGSLHADGRLQDGGGQWDFSTDVEARSSERDSWKASADVIVVAENEMYVRLQDLRAEDQSSFPLPFQLLRGKWVRLPAAGNALGSPVTPDPQFLQMQAEVVSVARDRGIVRLDGDRVYHYDTAVDEEKFIAFLEQVAASRKEPFDVEETRRMLSSTELIGELWIGADDFLVHRVVWSAKPRTDEGYTGSLSLTLRDHNAAPPVVPPENPVSLEDYLLDGGSADLPVLLEGDTMTPEQERQLRDLLEQ